MTTEIDDEITYCAVHPDRETALRCNRCDRYMCSQCAVSTPVGYRCQQCVRQVEDRFYNDLQTDPLIAFAVAAGMALVCGLLLGWLDRFSLLVAVILGFPAGGLISEWVARGISNRKGRNTWMFAVGGIVIGAAVGALIIGFLTYPEGARAFYEYYSQLSPTDQQAIATFGGDLPPTQVEYAIESVFSAANLLFTGFAAFAVYLRIKS